MKSKSALFLYAFWISFIGTLPLGTLNVSVTYLSIHQSAAAACQFAVGAVLVELLVVWMALFAVGKMHYLRPYYRWLGWLSVLVLLVVASISLQAAVEQRGFSAGLPFTRQQPFLSGMLLSLLNPLHLPFWVGWSAVLSNRGYLQRKANRYSIFLMAIGIGTLLAFLLYGIAGATIIQRMSHQQYLVNWAVGLSLLGVAVWQAFKLLRAATAI